MPARIALLAPPERIRSIFQRRGGEAARWSEQSRALDYSEGSPRPLGGVAMADLKWRI
jgi:hypothetical protein